MKKYSPPRVTTKRGKPWRRRRTGRRGMVKSPVPSLAPTTGSFSSGAPMSSPSSIHVDWTNSNWRPRCAPRKRKRSPRSTPSSSRVPSGSERAVARAAPEHAVDPHHGPSLSEGVARVRAPDVASRGRLEPLRIVVAVEEIVVPRGVGAERGVVLHGTERERGAAPPAPHHLGREHLLLVRARRARLQETAERRHALVQLAHAPRRCRSCRAPRARASAGADPSRRGSRARTRPP